MKKEKILSCFIDESGEFGSPDETSRIYYVAMVFHEQDKDITKNIKLLDDHITKWNYPKHAIHTGPLIRREGFYKNDERDNRRALFNALYHFSRRLDIKYVCPRIDKKDLDSYDDITMVDKLSKAITAELKKHYEYLASFDKIIVYYDNGQTPLTRIIASVFNAIFTTVEHRKVKPVDYKLFQVADLVCTMEMVNDKAKLKTFSNSETAFFGTPKNFIKNLYRQFSLKKL